MSRYTTTLVLCVIMTVLWVFCQFIPNGIVNRLRIDYTMLKPMSEDDEFESWNQTTSTGLQSTKSVEFSDNLHKNITEITSKGDDATQSSKPFIQTTDSIFTRRYMCPAFEGRLGNQLFQYASVYGISRAMNYTMILGRDDDVVKYFEVPSAEVRLSRDICLTFVKKKCKYCCTFDETLMHLENTHNYLLGRYLQSWKYFQHVFKQLRTELRFKKSINESTHNIVQNYTERYSRRNNSNATVLVGVHIRRGDIVSSSEIHSIGIFPAPEKYIHNAVDYFTDKYSHIVFLVSSDDIGYAKRLMNYTNRDIFFLNESPIQDMAIISSCDHVIITVGTFGWWAGILGKGTVVYYKYPAKEGSPIRSEFNYDDYFPKEWIGLE